MNPIVEDDVTVQAAVNAAGTARDHLGVVHHERTSPMRVLQRDGS
jgi:hypothetical protein